MDFRLFRRLVGGVDTGKIANFPCPRLLVEPLGVALFTHAKGCIDKHLDKLPFTHEIAHQIPLGTERRDKGGEHDKSRIHHEFCHFADPADILLAGGVIEAEIATEAVAHIVPIQQIGVLARGGQRLLQRPRQGGFARPGEPGEPDHQGFLPLLLGPALFVDGMGMPHDIAHPTLLDWRSRLKT